jgi:hypothetical protein
MRTAERVGRKDRLRDGGLDGQRRRSRPAAAAAAHSLLQSRFHSPSRRPSQKDTRLSPPAGLSAYCWRLFPSETGRVEQPMWPGAFKDSRLPRRPVAVVGDQTCSVPRSEGREVVVREALTL